MFLKTEILVGLYWYLWVLSVLVPRICTRVKDKQKLFEVSFGTESIPDLCFFFWLYYDRAKVRAFPMASKSLAHVRFDWLRTKESTALSASHLAYLAEAPRNVPLL